MLESSQESNEGSAQIFDDEQFANLCASIVKTPIP
jgi:hypothetical protein